ncbi:MAG: sugar phosphate isomerase/epimerase [Phycisphaerae bacterium]|nr:sugar phosphate isomerase/epimerase [Phycisphaerae bacterium]
MKLCMMSYTVSRRKDFFDLKRMLDLTVELGLEGIDFVTLHDESPRTLKSMCDDRGLKIVCHTFMADLNHPTAEERQPGVETCKQGIENAVALGAPVIMLPTKVIPGRSSAESRRNWIEGLKDVAPIAKDAGVILTVENFPGKESPFVTADHFLEAAGEVPGLKLTYDSGNAGSGEDPAESFRRTASHAVHAHFKDWEISDQPQDGYREMLDGRYYKPALIGEGDIPHKPVIEAMKSAGYEGFINIEYEGDKYDPYEGIRRAVEYLRGLGV